VREKEGYKWVCGLHPHTHMYSSLLLVGDLLNAYIADISSIRLQKIGFNPKEI
jgi:hypothetical protein